mgnify:CR=1 FL=1
MDSKFRDWLKEDSRFIKVKVGEEYEAIFRSLNFDETGGFKGKPTVKYLLEDIEDGKTREFSSSSKVLADKMSRLSSGDRIIISGLLDENERKTYRVTLVKGGEVREAGEEKLPPIPF